MTWRFAPYFVVLGLFIGAWWHGHATGRDAALIDQLRAIEALEHELEQVSAANRAAAAQIEALRAARAAIAREVEDEARADPDASRRVPSPDSLLRLKRRWAAP